MTRHGAVVPILWSFDNKLWSLCAFRVLTDSDETGTPLRWHNLAKLSEHTHHLSPYYSTSHNSQTTARNYLLARSHSYPLVRASVWALVTIILC